MTGEKRRHRQLTVHGIQKSKPFGARSQDQRRRQWTLRRRCTLVERLERQHAAHRDVFVLAEADDLDVHRFSTSVSSCGPNSSGSVDASTWRFTANTISLLVRRLNRCAVSASRLNPMLTVPKNSGPVKAGHRHDLNHAAWVRPQRHGFFSMARIGDGFVQAATRVVGRQAAAFGQHRTGWVGDQQQIASNLALIAFGDRLDRRSDRVVMAAFMFDRSATSRPSRA